MSQLPYRPLFGFERPLSPFKEKQVLRYFDFTWRKCEEIHLVDTLGGAQYQRVRAEWIAAGYPSGVVRFIRQRANLPAPPQPGAEGAGSEGAP